MLIILAIYFGLIWLVFFKFKLLPWTRSSKITSGLVGLLRPRVARHVLRRYGLLSCLRCLRITTQR